MSISSRALVETVLLGPMNNRRQLQNSPILGDVWIAYASKPSAPLDLLITPYKERPAGPVAVNISKGIEKLGSDRRPGQEAQVAYLEGLVAARLFFREVFRVVLPMTKWWQEWRQEWEKKDEIKPPPNKRKSSKKLTKKPQLNPIPIEAIIKFVHSVDEDAQIKLDEALSISTGYDRYFALAGIILWAAGQDKRAGVSNTVVDLLADVKGSDPIVEELNRLFEDVLHDDSIPPEPQIWQVSLNRKAMPALERSVPAVKGDAARSLFNVKCENITWAVIDSGIDGSHEVFFRDKISKSSRIIKAFDFSNIRKIVSLDNLDTSTPAFKQRVKELRKGPAKDLTEKDAGAILEKLAKDADDGRPIHWELVEKFIKIDPNTVPPSDHGTHVAGIIGAKRFETTKDGVTDFRYADGMCPDINLYDFRVLSKSLQDTEFAIIAALQYIRYLNERHGYMTIHGANLSLSIPHDVRNYACGCTPICNECERLVESGVVVVAAAGNLGYQRFETIDGSYEGYAAFSITDPGNADGVITVGATHRYRPHTYGVSFFSSRGPTGDGRWKPDLVAPGERIESALPGKNWGELDGTSMATPHVSGAAAMLMARYVELIGEPRRIKDILCESATDLGRERSFQGHGMLDVLRAFQKI